MRVTTLPPICAAPAPGPYRVSSRVLPVASRARSAQRAFRVAPPASPTLMAYSAQEPTGARLKSTVSAGSPWALARRRERQERAQQERDGYASSHAPASNHEARPPGRDSPCRRPPAPRDPFGNPENV